jgi:hypothetical protein
MAVVLHTVSIWREQPAPTAGGVMSSKSIRSETVGVTVVSRKDLARMVSKQTQPTAGMKSALAKAQTKPR